MRVRWIAMRLTLPRHLVRHEPGQWTARWPESDETSHTPPADAPLASHHLLWSPVERLVMTGGARLNGEGTVGGGKNSALKLMAASLLAEGRTHLAAVPAILDVDIMGEVLRRL